MRAFVVVLVTTAIDARLLRLQIATGRMRGLGLQRSMHPLMAPVLLRGGGCDQLGQNPETNPLDGEGRQSAQSRGRKRDAVVSPHDLRESVLLKEPEEDWSGHGDCGRQHAPAGGRYRLQPSTIGSG